MTLKSSCCEADVEARFYSGGEGYRCRKCGKPCEAREESLANSRECDFYGAELAHHASYCSFCKKDYDEKDLTRWECAEMIGRLCKDCIKKHNVPKDELKEALSAESESGRTEEGVDSSNKPTGLLGVYPSENSAGEEVKKIFKEVSKKLTGKDFEVARKETQKEIIRYANLIERIRNRVVGRMHTDDGGYDSTAEDIRKMLIDFDKGD